MIGAVAGGILGQIIPFDMTGIDFCMTALFVIIFIGQWEKAESHIPAIAGIVIAVVTKITSIPLTLSTLSYSISGKISCSLIPTTKQ